MHRVFIDDDKELLQNVFSYENNDDVIVVSLELDVAAEIDALEGFSVIKGKRWKNVTVKSYDDREAEIAVEVMHTNYIFKVWHEHEEFWLVFIPITLIGNDNNRINEWL